ncbi:MAG: Ig-like domain-containing protein [Methylocystis sp.]|nr:Ig-like domain-containing protein [Methylocystis sp.]
MSCRLLSATTVASALLCLSANAKCIYKPFEFFPEKNGAVVVESRIDGETPCKHNFAEGEGYHFTSLTIDRAPEHGALTQTGDTQFVFTPNAGFSGKDAYIFEICATKGDEAGCSTIAFVATIRSRR